MPAHDIIDNRKEILVDHINRILSSTETARFAVGYFFLSGLTSIADKEILFNRFNVVLHRLEIVCHFLFSLLPIGCLCPPRYLQYQD